MLQFKHEFTGGEAVRHRQNHFLRESFASARRVYVVAVDGRHVYVRRFVYSEHPQFCYEGGDVGDPQKKVAGSERAALDSEVDVPERHRPFARRKIYIPPLGDADFGVGGVLNVRIDGVPELDSLNRPVPPLNWKRVPHFLFKRQG